MTGQGGLAGGTSTFVLQATKTESLKQPPGANLSAERQTRSPPESLGRQCHLYILLLRNIHKCNGKPGYLDPINNFTSYKQEQALARILQATCICFSLFATSLPLRLPSMDGLMDCYMSPHNGVFHRLSCNTSGPWVSDALESPTRANTPPSPGS